MFQQLLNTASIGYIKAQRKLKFALVGDAGKTEPVGIKRGIVRHWAWQFTNAHLVGELFNVLAIKLVGAPSGPGVRRHLCYPTCGWWVKGIYTVVACL